MQLVQFLLIGSVIVILALSIYLFYRYRSPTINRQVLFYSVGISSIGLAVLFFSLKSERIRTKFYAQTGDSRVLFSHDFDDLGLLARGEYDPEKDQGWNSPNHDTEIAKRPISTMAIVSDGIDTVFAHYYDQGHCGDQPSVDYPTYTFATGTYFSTYIKANQTGYNDLYLSWNLKTSPGFYAGAKNHVYSEMKFPGLESEKYSGSSSTDGGAVRLRYSNWDDGNNYIRWLCGLAQQTSGYEEMVGDFNDTIDTRGTIWHNYTMRVSNNTGSNYDGLIEFFYDGVLVGSKTGLQLTKKNNEFIKMMISTAGGGDYSEHVFESDMYLYYDDIVVWQGGASAPARGVASASGRVLDMPTECDWPKGN